MLFYQYLLLRLKMNVLSFAFCYLICLPNLVELKQETSSHVANDEKRKFTHEWQQIADGKYT